MIGYPIVYRFEDSHAISIVGLTDFNRPSARPAGVAANGPAVATNQNVRAAPQPTECQAELEENLSRMNSEQLESDTLIAYREYDQGSRVHFSDLSFKLSEQINQADAQPEKGARTVISMNFLKEYLARDRRHVFYVLEWTVSRKLHFPPVCFSLSEMNTAIPLPPPDLA